MAMEGLIYTNDNCISCNKCVKVCTSPGASYLHVSGDTSAVHIDEKRCVSCGACFAICEHDAREYRDDTQAFFDDLRRGEPISVLLAPAFKASYPDEYAAVLGGLKALGVRRIISVAFGADICTWAYLKLIRSGRYNGSISSPCPATVSYIEHCAPKMIPLLMPVYSPMLCAAIYCRKVLGITDRLAFIGPCIAKKLETSAYGDSPVEYNVTFLKLMKYVREHNIYGLAATDEIEYGLGSFYPAPGGLADNVRWFMGDDTPIRVVSGKTYLYGWLHKNEKRLLNHETPFTLIDALNCHDGCIEGTATEYRRYDEDRAYYNIQKIRRASKRESADSPWSEQLSPEERLKRLDAQFAKLNIYDYIRTYKDRSAHCEMRMPSAGEADRIFNDMHKTTPESRRINCSTCGYDSCYDLMVAIYNGFNDRRSCIHYEMSEALRLERLSYCDTLTNVMNRNALEQMLSSEMYREKSVAVIAADINGLKDVNDTLGHEAGDRLIVDVAGALSQVFSRSKVYRTGGDEFVVILQDFSEDECVRCIQRVREILKQKNASAALGYAYSHVYQSNITELKSLADKEMYADKSRYYRETGKKRR